MKYTGIYANNFNTLMQNVKKEKELNVIVLQDYSKGYITQDIIKKFIKTFTNATIFINPQSVKLDNIDLSNTIIKMNHHEAFKYSGCSYLQAEDLCMVLKRNINSKFIIITDSYNGAYIYDRELDTVFHVVIDGVSTKYGVKPIPTEHTLSAGDIMFGALAYKYSITNDIIESVEFGVKAGTASLKSIQTYIPSIDEINSINVHTERARPSIHG
ncbi:MAG: Bifunctional protein HldE [Firmicutes bacterium ADurb.Bin419]|nr:MAG: Bifunctional protein HldE [Firmicutes bacterium ADurb.Bin419]